MRALKCWMLDEVSAGPGMEMPLEYIPCDCPTQSWAERRRRSPPACPGCRKWHARCHNSTSTCHGSINSAMAKQRTSSINSPRPVDKFRS